MGKALSSRVRAVLVLSTAGVTLVATTTFAAAHHDGDAATLHACVTKGDGQLRLVASGETCRSSEKAVRWSVSGGDAAAVEELRAALKATDGSVNDGDGLVHWTNLDGVPQPVLEADTNLSSFMLSLAGARPVGGPDLVHWTNLGGVPDGLADGVHPDDILGQLLGRHLAPDSVGGLQIAERAINSAELAQSAVTAEHISAGSIFAHHLAGSDFGEVVRGAVTSEKIADGTVEARDLAARSVTSDKLALASATFTDVDRAMLAPLTNGYQEVPHSTAVLTLGAPARVAVSAQLQLSCICNDPSDAAVVTYQLVRVTDPGAAVPSVTAVSPSYVAQLRPGQTTLPVSLSMLDTAGAGDHAYRVRLVAEQSGTTTSAVTPSNTVVSAYAVGPA